MRQRRLKKATINCLLLGVTMLILPQISVAQDKLNLCNGVWTTKACEKPEKSLDAIIKPDSPAINKDNLSANTDGKLKDTTAIIHPLNMKVISIRNNYNKDYDISKVKRACQGEDANITECKKYVAEELEKIREYELELERLALEEQQLAESTKLNQNTAPQQNVVTVNQITNTVNRNRFVNIDKSISEKNDTKIINTPNKDQNKPSVPEQKISGAWISVK